MNSPGVPVVSEELPECGLGVVPRPPVLPTLSWPLTWEARQESSKMFVTEFISTTDAVGTGKQEVFSWVECLRVLQCGGRKRTNYMRQHLITKD